MFCIFKLTAYDSNWNFLNYFNFISDWFSQIRHSCIYRRLSEESSSSNTVKMPLPGKSVYLRGGMSVPTTDPYYTDSISCNSGSSSSFLSGASETCRMESVAGFQDLRTDGWTGQTYNPRNSMAFNSAKGLLNPVGENNCFLNCAVQVYNFARTGK